ncbi:hypothetical protein GF336_07700 [Candidatus Woesearchaeota archaeon]|nr:hypothetical protein [Candidatus Woesearchaeota archaeon]
MDTKEHIPYVCPHYREKHCIYKGTAESEKMICNGNLDHCKHEIKGVLKEYYYTWKALNEKHPKEDIIAKILKNENKKD